MVVVSSRLFGDSWWGSSSWFTSWFSQAHFLTSCFRHTVDQGHNLKTGSSLSCDYCVQFVVNGIPNTEVVTCQVVQSLVQAGVSKCFCVGEQVWAQQYFLLIINWL